MINFLNVYFFSVFDNVIIGRKLWLNRIIPSRRKSDLLPKKSLENILGAKKPIYCYEMIAVCWICVVFDRWHDDHLRFVSIHFDLGTVQFYTTTLASFTPFRITTTKLYIIDPFVYFLALQEKGKYLPQKNNNQRSLFDQIHFNEKLIECFHCFWSTKRRKKKKNKPLINRSVYAEVIKCCCIFFVHVIFGCISLFNSSVFCLFLFHFDSNCFTVSTLIISFSIPNKQTKKKMRKTKPEKQIFTQSIWSVY